MLHIYLGDLLELAALHLRWLRMLSAQAGQWGGFATITCQRLPTG